MTDGAFSSPRLDSPLASQYYKLLPAPAPDAHAVDRFDASSLLFSAPTAAAVAPSHGGSKLLGGGSGGGSTSISDVSSSSSSSAHGGSGRPSVQPSPTMMSLNHLAPGFGSDLHR